MGPMNREITTASKSNGSRTRNVRQPDAHASRRWTAAVLTLGILVGAFAGAAIGSLYSVARHAIPVRAVIAKSVARSSAISVDRPLLEAKGYVVASREASVSAKSIYKVNEVSVREGQSVKQGQVIALLDDTNVRASLEQSRARLKQVEAVLAAAKEADDDARPIFLRRQRQLTEGLISQEAFDASKAAYDSVHSAVLVADGNVAAAKAAVVIEERYEDDTQIRSPFDGVVTTRNAQPGQIVSPQFSGGGGIAKIVDMHSLEVDVDVSESLINQVHLRQRAVITPVTYPESNIPGEVLAINPAADRLNASRKVRISFKQKDPRIVPEMGVRVAFSNDAAPYKPVALGPSSSVEVPVAAVQTDGDFGVVFVVSGDTAERRIVQLGARSAGVQTILSGLKPGSMLAIGNFGDFHDKLKVRIVK
jgi:RND family efflux transporter MFP subunit